jgi:hypothetical protein
LGLEKSVAEREVLRDAVGIRGVNHGGLAEAAHALGVFGLGQVTAARVGAHDFAGASDLEPFGHGFSGFDAFGTSHKFIISIAKGRALYQ